MTLEILKVPYECKIVNMFAGETRAPEFLKLNPQHTVPVYKDGDLVLNESRAILTYLATTHGGGQLYPADPKVRAKVDCRLYFDAGFFNKTRDIIVRERERKGGRGCRTTKKP